MPGLGDLEERLAALRRQIALAKPGAYTPLQILQMRRDCQRLWEQIDAHRREQLTSLVAHQLMSKPTA